MHAPTATDETTFTTPHAPKHLAASLELGAQTAASSAQLAARTIAAGYDEGSLSARETLQALYGWDALITRALKLLERAKEDIRGAMEAPAIRVDEPVEIEGRGTITWIAPVPTVSYPPKDVTRLSNELANATHPVQAALEQLRPLLDHIPQLVAGGHLSDDTGTALVDGVQQLAMIGSGAHAIANELQSVRKDGVKSGYVKVEAVRSRKAAPADDPPF